MVDKNLLRESESRQKAGRRVMNPSNNKKTTIRVLHSILNYLPKITTSLKRLFVLQPLFEKKQKKTSRRNKQSSRLAPRRSQLARTFRRLATSETWSNKYQKNLTACLQITTMKTFWSSWSYRKRTTKAKTRCAWKSFSSAHKRFSLMARRKLPW